ncbi:DUF2726 domain-containing protein [Frigidibacter sp. MR17.24]|uniref:DUF2726 domain-containing protein n=1 Tax=Frigidibacter sp. MR17.24 TaxID=3127345 RepID=UPI003012A272
MYARRPDASRRDSLEDIAPPAGTCARAVFDPCEIDWLGYLDIAVETLGDGHRLAPQLSLAKLVTLPAGASAWGRVLRHRADFTVLDRDGRPVAVLEIAAGAHARDLDRAGRWQDSRRLLEAAGIACHEITGTTDVETLFCWLAPLLDPAHGRAAPALQLIA